jgi:predicted acyltransferase
VTPQTRLTSLDALRGLTMAAMVVVNNPGDWGHVYAPLLHAEWHGWTPTDLVFPFFLFIVGVSITLSRGTMGNPWRIVRRAAIIFGLGLFLAGFPRFPLATMRIPGVLPRIALCYLAAAFIYRASAPAPAPAPSGGDTRLAVHPTRVLLWAVGLSLGYWAIVSVVPFPGGMAGVLEPGKDIGAWVDRALFGNHLYAQTKTWDPEGLVSTIPAIATTLLGVCAGLCLATDLPAGRKALVLVVAGLVAIGVGWTWGLVFPINKKLWTSSYVWFTAGWASAALGVCVWLVDVRGWRRWCWPFVVLGSNAMVLFVASGVLVKSMGLVTWTLADGRSVSLRGAIYRSWFVPYASPYNASLLFALADLAVLFVLLYALYRKQWFLKV